MKLSIQLFLAGALSVSGGFLSCPVMAQQEAAEQATVAQEQHGAAYECRVVELKNVSPEVMAWWLDPVHNETPAGMSMQTMYRTTYRKVDFTPGDAQKLGPWKEKNPGLQMVVPQHEYNRVMVIGTPEAIASVEANVALLDQKPQEVELVAQFVQIAPEDMVDLGIKNLTVAPKTAKFRLGFANMGVEDRLKTLVETGKAKIIDSSRKTVPNNTATGIEAKSVSPASLSVPGEQGEARKMEADDRTGPLEVQLLSSVYVMPSVNGDNTITIRLDRARSLALSNTVLQMPLRTFEQSTSIANVRDTETLVLCGLTGNDTVSDAIGGVKGANVVLLLTPKVVREGAE